MVVLKSVVLSDNEVEEIKIKNSTYNSLKELLNEFDEGTPKNVVEATIREYTKAKLHYEEWFKTAQFNHKLSVASDNYWNVDFDKKELQVLA